MELKITTLIENSNGISNSLICEHGLSYYIEVNNKHVLFDTGSTGAFIENAIKLNIDLYNLDYVILSHGHDDHTGGFKTLIETYGDSYKLFIGDGFFDRKYKMLNETYNYDGIPFDKQLIIDMNYFIVKDKIVKLNEFIYVNSQFESINIFEQPEKRYFVRNNSTYQPDTFKEEIALIIKLKKGLIVFLGCSHIGVVNILETIKKRMNKNIFGVFGGTHLIRASDERVYNTIDYFNKENIKLLGLSHCTGKKATTIFKDHFKGHFVPMNTGDNYKVVE